MLYHLEQRHIDGGLIPFCLQRDIAIVGYSPFGHGRFPPPSTRPGKLLAEIAARRGATPRQIALAFLTRKPPLFTIPKSSNLAHVRENAGALSLQLDPDDLALLEKAFPANEEADLPML